MTEAKDENDDIDSENQANNYNLYRALMEREDNT